MSELRHEPLRAVYVVEWQGGTVARPTTVEQWFVADHGVAGVVAERAALERYVELRRAGEVRVRVRALEFRWREVLP